MDNSRITLATKEEASCTATSFYLSFDNDAMDDGYLGNGNVNDTSTMSDMYKTIENIDQEDLGEVQQQEEDEEEDDADITPCLSKDEQQKNNNSTLENLSSGIMLSPGHRLTPKGVSPFRSLSMPQYILRDLRACSTPTKEQSGLGSAKVKKMAVMLEEGSDKPNEGGGKKELNDSYDHNKENISPNDSGERTPKSSSFSPVKSVNADKEYARGHERVSPFPMKRNFNDEGHQQYYQHQPLQEIRNPDMKLAKELLLSEVEQCEDRKTVLKLDKDPQEGFNEYLREIDNNKGNEEFISGENIETLAASDKETMESEIVDNIMEMESEILRKELEKRVRKIGFIERGEMKHQLDKETNEKRKSPQEMCEEDVTDKDQKKKPLKMVRIVEENEEQAASPKKTGVEATRRSIYARKSLLPTLKVTKNVPVRSEEKCPSTAPREAVEIPQLIDKMIKITEKQKSMNPVESGANLRRTERIVERKKQASTGRASLLPSSGLVWPEKKRYSFTNRMSTVLKTTLNSPGRKIGGGNRSGTTATTNAVGAAAGSNTNRAITTAGTVGKMSIKPEAKKGKDMDIEVHDGTANKKLAKKVEFCCPVCKEKFRIKSLYEAHKRTHESMEGTSTPAAMVTSSLMSLTESSTSTSTASLSGRSNMMSQTPSMNCNRLTSGTPQCKYCDKKFALIRTLHIHLLQNCHKIPPSEKRKLHYTEMDHEEKAQLPKVFSSSTSASAAASASTSVTTTTTTMANIMTTSWPSSTMTKTGIPKISVAAKLNNTNVGHKHLMEAAHIQSMKREGATSTRQSLMGAMAPPPLPAQSQSTSTASAKLQVMGPSEAVNEVAAPPQRPGNKAHTGIYRTPSKAIVCHLCKMTFKSVLGYTQHNLSAHNNKKIDVADSNQA